MEFWFNSDPTLAIPLVCVYDIRKRRGLIPNNMPFNEFSSHLEMLKMLRMCEFDIDLKLV